jgi:hypothetical protein
MESMPLSMLKRLEDEVPPVFMILDTFDKDVKTLSPGTHLFCVYGDNWYEKNNLDNYICSFFFQTCLAK